jgi:hypothetical protein
LRSNYALGKLTIAEYQELLTFTSSNLSKEGKKVVRNTSGVLTHDTSGVSTTRVEVSQQSTVPLLELLTGLLQVASLSVNKVGDNVLDHGLGAAICVGRSNGAVLRNRNHVGETSSIAVDGSGGGEDDIVDVVALHGAEQRDTAADIDTVVLERDLARLADSLDGVSRG